MNILAFKYKKSFQRDLKIPYYSPFVVDVISFITPSMNRSWLMSRCELLRPICVNQVSLTNKTRIIWLQAVLYFSSGCVLCVLSPVAYVEYWSTQLQKSSWQNNFIFIKIFCKWLSLTHLSGGIVKANWRSIRNSKGRESYYFYGWQWDAKLESSYWIGKLLTDCDRSKFESNSLQFQKHVNTNHRQLLWSLQGHQTEHKWKSVLLTLILALLFKASN